MPVTEDINLLDPEFLKSVQCREAFARLRKERPIFWHEGASPDGGFWVVLKHADVVEVSSQPGVYSSERGVFIYDHQTDSRGALLFTDPPEHKRLRRFVNKHFIGRGVASIEPWIRKECASLIDRAVQAGDIDFIKNVAVDLPLNTIGEMMRLDMPTRRRMLAISDEMASAGAGGEERTFRAVQAMCELGIELGRERRAKPDDDLLSAMVSVTDGDGDRLEDVEFGMMFMQIAGAATDTTRGVIGDIVLRLAQNPDLFQEVKNNPQYVRGLIEEVLRMSPPVYYMRRTATCDTTLRSVPIRAGDRVVMYYLSANYDSDVFDEPERFDIHRSHNPHLTFGTGEHVCLGLNVARLEIRVLFEELIRQVSSIELTGPVEQDMNTESTRYQSMPVRVVR